MSDIQIILVVGAPGSGTTAVAGALAALGVPVPGPYDRNNDPRTPVTYESMAFTRALRLGLDESTLERKPSGDMVGAMRDLLTELERGRLVNWQPGKPKRAAFKRPMAGVVLRELVPIFEPTVIFVHRPMADVEATRMRRDWSSALSDMRPPTVLCGTFEALVDSGWPFLGLSYPELVKTPSVALHRIIAFAGLSDLTGNIERAKAFIRPAKEPS